MTPLITRARAWSSEHRPKVARDYMLVYSQSRELVPQLCDALDLAMKALEGVIEHEESTLKFEPEIHFHNGYRQKMYLRCRNALQKLRGEG